MRVTKENITELCVDIVGYEGLYKIYPNGKIWSYPKKHGCSYWKGFWMKTFVDGRGYPFIRLCKNGVIKQPKIHKLLAEAFIPNPNNYIEINHINAIRSDNRLKNLEWCTHSENIKHDFIMGNKNQIGEKNNLSVLKENNVIEIRKLKS